MAVIQKLKKQSDRRTALLGLAADRPASPGVCLMPEEMAELVENTCPIEKKEQYLLHVAVCESCYREWLTLHEVLGKMPESKRESRVFKIFKSGEMALFGTLLAAAASVIVFLNITHTVTENESIFIPVAPMRQEVSLPEQERGASPLDRVSQTERQVEDKERPNSLKLDMNLEKSSQRQKESVAHDADRSEKKKSVPQVPAVPSPAPVFVPKDGISVQRSFPVQQALPKSSGEDVTQKAIRSRVGSGIPISQHDKGQIGIITFGQWRDQLENGCAERQESTGFWREIEEKGRRLMENPEELDAEERDILKKLLLLTVGIEKKNAAERCRRMRDLLAEERKNR